MSSKNNPFPDDVKASVQRVWLAGLGALSMAEQEGGKLFRNLVEKGTSFEARGKARAEDLREKAADATGEVREKAGEIGADLRERLAETGERVRSALGGFERRIDQAVQGAFERAGVPTREEIAVLSKRIEELTRLVEKLKKPESKA